MRLGQVRTCPFCPGRIGESEREFEGQKGREFFGEIIFPRICLALKKRAAHGTHMGPGEPKSRHIEEKPGIMILA